MRLKIVAHNRLSYGSLKNAICSRGTSRAKIKVWRGNLDCSFDSVWFLAFTR